jgi:hypothetical protein
MAAHETAHASTDRPHPRPSTPVSPMKSRRIRTLHLAVIAGESRRNIGVLGRPFASVPSCSWHVGPQRDRSDGRKGPQANDLRCLRRRCKRRCWATSAHAAVGWPSRPSGVCVTNSTGSNHCQWTLAAFARQAVGPWACCAAMGFTRWPLAHNAVSAAKVRLMERWLSRRRDYCEHMFA